MRLCIATGAALAALTSASAHAAIVNVNVFNFDFSVNQPGEPIVDAVVNVGDRVDWYFIDGGHSVTSVGGIPEVFYSGIVEDSGVTFYHTFTEVGTWWYYCIAHGSDMGRSEERRVGEEC